MKRAVRIKDIADALGLSRNTVSNALNGRHVPEKTRKLVIEKAKEMNYKSMNLNDNKRRDYRILLVSGKPLSNIDYYFKIIQSIENFAFNNNYQLFQHVFNNNYSSFEVIVEYLKNYQIDGIVCIEAFDDVFIKQLVKLDMPICFIDYSAKVEFYNRKFDIVNSDNYFSVYKLINKIIKDKGIKSFSFVGDHLHCLSFFERYQGMLSAINMNKINHRSEQDVLLDDRFDYGNPNKLKFELANKIHNVECFVCANDFIARNVINSLKALRKKVPNDVLVIGYDNSKEAINTHPYITTIEVQQKEIGEQAIKNLINRIEDRNLPSKIITIDTNLILRETTSI